MCSAALFDGKAAHCCVSMESSLMILAQTTSHATLGTSDAKEAPSITGNEGGCYSMRIQRPQAAHCNVLSSLCASSGQSNHQTF